MKRLRRLAALLAALLLGLAAWLSVLVCYPAQGELRLSRQLSTGLLIARVPEPQPLLFDRVFFGRPQLSGRHFQPEIGKSRTLPPGGVSVHRAKNGEWIWHIRLDPLDKRWEIEVTEKRSVSLRLGAKSWRIGTKTRIWRTRRVEKAEDV
jgi:hypothetical protein